MKNIRYLFPEGRPKAMTLSYDDGVADDRRLAELFNRHGLKASFHLNSALMGQGNHVPAEEIAALYAGHEISCHSANHPFLERVPRIAALNQVLADRRALEKLAGHPVRGMSYPMGTYDAEVKRLLEAAGIVYCRTTRATKAFGLPDDWLEWHPTCHHHDAAALGEAFKATRHSFALFYVWGHSYEFDRDGNWDMMENFCRAMAGRPDIWYAANIEIHDYLTALRRLEFGADSDMAYNPSARPLWLAVDGAPVEIPAGTLAGL